MSDTPLGHALGNQNAPVVVEEWADFQCPFCRRFFEGAGRALRKTYVANGKALFVFHNFPFLGPESLLAAEAAECAGEQGRFWDYHDKLFEEQQGENQGGFRPARLDRFAADLGLDVLSFDHCLQSQQCEPKVQRELDAGEQLGVSWTPTIIVNGVRLPGVPSWDELRAVIDSQAQAA
jgi:protein-disulfide isomerase